VPVEAARARGLRARRQRREPPEDSIRLRAVVGAMVLVSLLAVIAQGGTDGFTAAAALLLVPTGYVFSYIQRRRSNVGAKVLLAVGLVIAFGAFLQSVRTVQTADEARIPLGTLFVWVQVLHSFDVPRRRDLAFSAVSSLILMAEAGALSLGSGFLVFLVPWLGLAGTWLALTQRPPRAAVASPAFVRRSSRPRRALALGRSAFATAAAVLFAVGTVFLALPRLPGAFVRLPPFAVRTGISVPGFDGSVVNPGLPAAGGDGVVDFSPAAYPGFGSSVDLRARGHLSDRIVMRVRSSQAALWRGQVYDTFDGIRWTESDPRTATVGLGWNRSFEIPAPEGGLAGTTRRIVTTFYVQAQGPNVVFAAYAPEEVFFPAAQLSIDGASSLRAPILLDPGLVYSVISDVPVTTPEQLRAAPESWPAATLAQYTQLPADLPARDVDLARAITVGASTTYDRVMAVQRWLRRNTRYDLDVPRDPPGVDAVDEFLFVRRAGFCEHIASAMAVLLRAVGVPTRFVTGYGPGDRNPFTGYFDVRESDAHAWVEVLYPGVGWVPYDPTFGVPSASPGLGARFIAPEVLRAIGRFVSRIVPEPVKATARLVASGLRSAARGASSAWPASVAALLALAALGWRRRARRRAHGPPLSPAARAFASLERAMSRRGRSRPAHRTPEEFLRSLEPVLSGGERDDARAIVRAFELDRFSGRPLSRDEGERALAAAARIARMEGDRPRR
jgi:transglutaminase-like putative cysteine protease